jgi:hypothetical protein
MVLVLFAVVIAVLLRVGLPLEESWTPIFKVTPVGIPLNVNLTCASFTGEEPANCARSNQAVRFPSVMTIDARGSATVLFVKTVAVPWFVWPVRAPTARLPIPGAKAVILSMDVVDTRTFVGDTDAPTQPVPPEPD